MTSRVVFDTNVLVSGYLWKGLARRAIEKARRGESILLISNATTEEFIRVLAYDKFGLRPQEIEPIIRDLLSISERVEVTSRIDAIKTDPTDNIFLALAVDGEADAIRVGRSPSPRP